MYDYVVTADDVGTLLAVDCTPMDDNGRQVVNKCSLGAISCHKPQTCVVNLCQVFAQLLNYQTHYGTSFVCKLGEAETSAIYF
jgi:hypothetical protein